MSLMCKMSHQCSTTKGMCVHEKMMVIVVVMALAAAGHYLLHLF